MIHWSLSFSSVCPVWQYPYQYEPWQDYRCEDWAVDRSVERPTDLDVSWTAFRPKSTGLPSERRICAALASSLCLVYRPPQLDMTDDDQTTSSYCPLSISATSQTRTSNQVGPVPTARHSEPRPAIWTLDQFVLKSVGMMMNDWVIINLRTEDS